VRKREREERREERLTRKEMDQKKETDRPREAESTGPRTSDKEGAERAESITQARRQVRELEAKLRAAREHLAQLEGRPRERIMRFEFAPGPRGFNFSPPPPGGPRPPGMAPPAPGPGGPRTERRLQELEQKFDRLMKELEELKHQRRSESKSDERTTL
jgi:hypothetical protein